MHLESHDCSRRVFIGKAVPGSALGLLVWYLTGCDAGDPGGEDISPGADSGISISGGTITIDLAKSDTAILREAGGFLLILSARTLVINLDGSTIRAFTSVCTHEGCDVDQFRNGRFVCPCHGSQYDTSGLVVVGPAPAALTEYAVVRNGDTVVITQ